MSPVCLAVARVVASALCSGSAVAQPRDHDHADAPLGTVNFPVSCAPEAQVKFNTAASLLYSFYWERIDGAVAEVLAADPTCAMAHWLKAVASLDNPLGSPPTPKLEQQGWAAVQEAKRPGGKTQRERDYIAAVEIVFKDHETVPFGNRAAAYEQGLEQLHVRYPEDSEAAILYAYWLQVTADRNDQAHAQQLRSAKILEEIFLAQPNHRRWLAAIDGSNIYMFDLQSPQQLGSSKTGQDSIVGLPMRDPVGFPQASNHYGMLWWTNADSTLPSVPRDAFWSWGLGDSLIIVIPSLDIVIARAGNAWRSGAWNANYAVLDPFIKPIVQSVAPKISVPQVVGLSQSAATAAIAQAGLAVSSVTQQPGSGVPAGNVISQTPAANAQVARNTGVKLTVSSGASP